MSSLIKNIQGALSGIRAKDLTYPTIFLLFIVIVGMIFYFATQFISKNINAIFSGDIGSESSSLNMANYTLITKKLGLTIKSKVDSATSTVSLPNSSGTPATTTGQTLDKKGFTINILNSTAKSGVAGTLALTLESAGFSKAKTGNKETPYATTTVAIKESVSSISPALLGTIRKYYPEAISIVAPENSQFDVTITIGSL